MAHARTILQPLAVVLLVPGLILGCGSGGGQSSGQDRPATSGGENGIASDRPAGQAGVEGGGQDRLSTRVAPFDQRAIERAHQFLASAKRGRDVLEMVHFGARYDGHEYNAEMSGRVTRDLPERHFALVYRYSWNGDGKTDVAFLCDPRGTVYAVRAVWTNAGPNQPFFFANLTIKVLGGFFIEAYKNDLTAEQKQWVEQIVADANAQALLEFALQFQQAFSS